MVHEHVRCNFSTNGALLLDLVTLSPISIRGPHFGSSLTEIPELPLALYWVRGNLNLNAITSLMPHNWILEHEANSSSLMSFNIAVSFSGHSGAG